MLKKTTSFLLTLLMISFAVITVCADVHIKGQTNLAPGDTAEYIISVDGCEKATSASVAIECGNGISVQSGSFIKEGSLKFFDIKTNKGAIGGLATGDINGEFFQFTVKAESDAELSRNFTVTVTAKNGAEEVYNQTATLVKGSEVTPKSSSQSVTVSSGDKVTVSQTRKTETASTAGQSEQLDDTSPLLYVILAIAAVAIAVFLVVFFKKKNKKPNPQD